MYLYLLISYYGLELNSSQSFHWFANMDSLHEIHRVLKPHGSLGMVWNIDDYNSPQGYEPTTEWETKLHDLTWTFDDELPRFRHEKWRQVFDEQIKKTPMSLILPSNQLFSLPLGEHDEKFEVRLSKEKLWERYNTLSHIARLEGAMREVRNAIESIPAITYQSSARINCSWPQSTLQMLRLTRTAMWRCMERRQWFGLGRYRRKVGRD